MPLLQFATPAPLQRAMQGGTDIPYDAPRDGKFRAWYMQNFPPQVRDRALTEVATRYLQGRLDKSLHAAPIGKKFADMSPADQNVVCLALSQFALQSLSQFLAKSSGVLTAKKMAEDEWRFKAEEYDSPSRDSSGQRKLKFSFFFWNREKKQWQSNGVYMQLQPLPNGL